MKRTVFFNIVLLLVVITSTAYGQTELQVYPASETMDSYLLTSIRAQTFPEGKMKIEFNDETEAVEYDISEKVKVVFDVSSSLPEDNSNSLVELSLYPNPVNQMLHINFVSDATSKAEICIFSLNGQEVFSQSYPVVTGTNHISISLSGLKTGVYLCHISNGKHSLTQKIIKE